MRCECKGLRKPFFLLFIESAVVLRWECEEKIVSTAMKKNNKISKVLLKLASVDKC